jgi:hypothetical protein
MHIKLLNSLKQIVEYLWYTATTGAVEQDPEEI